MSLLSSMTARRSQRPSGELFAPRAGTGFRIVADLMNQCRSTMQPFSFNNGSPNWLLRIRPELARWPNCRLSSQSLWTSLAASDSSQSRRRVNRTCRSNMQTSGAALGDSRNRFLTLTVLVPQARGPKYSGSGQGDCGPGASEAAWPGEHGRAAAACARSDP